ncbi:MAG: hypothetical protein HeimC2_40580 [Candidatus Heimdallarchaeota archaeon LC_2]|nr:MAG: hypothetical protein HeimC2_40580 [Candidatus Heimdallarchaeota archaeon LC_2]
MWDKNIEINLVFVHVIGKQVTSFSSDFYEGLDGIIQEEILVVESKYDFEHIVDIHFIKN